MEEIELKTKKTELKMSNFKWKKSHLQKFKTALKKYGYGNSANKKIAEYICDSLLPSDIAYIKSFLKKLFKMTSMKDIVDSKKFQKYIDNYKDEENLSIKDQNANELVEDTLASHSPSNDTLVYDSVTTHKEEIPKDRSLNIVLKRSVILDHINSLKKEKSKLEKAEPFPTKSNFPPQNIPLEINLPLGRPNHYPLQIPSQYFRGTNEMHGDYKAQKYDFENHGHINFPPNRNPYIANNEHLNVSPSPHNFGEDLPSVSQTFIPKDSTYFSDRGSPPYFNNEPSEQSLYYTGIRKYPRQSYPPYKLYHNNNVIPKYPPQQVPVYPPERPPVYNMYGNQSDSYRPHIPKHQDMYIENNSFGDKDGYMMSNRNINQINERNFYPSFNSHNLMYTNDISKNYPPHIYTNENSLPPPPPAPRKYMRYIPLNQEQYNPIMEHNDPFYHVNK